MPCPLTRYTLRLALLVAIAHGCLAPAAEPTSPPAGTAPPTRPIPIELLARLSQVSQATLSPDGTALAALNEDAPDQTGVVLLDWEKGTRQDIGGSKRFTCRSIHWLGNQYLVVNVVRYHLYYGGVYLAKRGDPREMTALPVTSANIDLVGAPRDRPGNGIFWGIHERDFVSYDNDPDLFELSPKNAWGHLGTYSIDRFAHMYPEPKKGIVVGYGADVNGELATCNLYEDGELRVLLFEAPEARWTPLAIRPDQATILLVEPDHRHLWISSSTATEGYAVSRMDTQTGALEKPIWTDPVYDTGEARVHYSHRSGALAGFSYDQKRQRNVWLLPAFASAQRAVDALLPATDNLLLDCDDKEERFLFVAQSATQPARYFLLDGTKGTLTSVANSRPWLQNFPLRPSQPINFVSRDGVKLEGYLTLPEGATADHPVPAVVLCHGGPHTRDTWDFDPEVQFLASCGYAVLQPNYRGSSGYLHTRTLADMHNYQRMHDDVTDATRALQRMPAIDPRRIAIMGASFGGYLAVAGVAFEPDLYRCAISNCGVFDWKKLADDAKRNGMPAEYEMLTDQLGKHGEKPAAFARLSPISAVDRIKVPVFIAHGNEDPIVDVEQSHDLAAALKKQHVPHEVFYRDDESHGFRLRKNREAYFAAIEVFLKKNLSAPEEAAVSRQAR